MTVAVSVAAGDRQHWEDDQLPVTLVVVESPYREITRAHRRLR
jgi:hypothetical protein